MSEFKPPTAITSPARKLLLGCLALATAGPASYSAGANADRATDYRLSIKPSICVSYDSEAPCEMLMLVSWEASQNADVCLKQAMQEPDLFCWQNARRGSVDIAYTDYVDLVYQLVEESSSVVLAEAEVMVINRDLRSSRKRRRHVWSIL